MDLQAEFQGMEISVDDIHAWKKLKDQDLPSFPKMWHEIDFSFVTAQCGPCLPHIEGADMSFSWTRFFFNYVVY